MALWEQQNGWALTWALGSNGHGCTDCDSDECDILGNKAQTDKKIDEPKRLDLIPESVLKC